jgi:hypothetical protein
VVSLDLRPRRLLLSTTELELVRRKALPAPLRLPPGFALRPVGGVAEPPTPEVHPAVADDLRVLARPELAVTLRAARPGLEVTACLAVDGPRGAGLLRTGDTAVELSAFAAVQLPGELARVVPAPSSDERPAVQQVPLDLLLAGGAGTRLAGRVGGTLHATVVAGDRSDRAGSVVGTVEWVWDGAGWTGLQPLPARGGRPWIGLVPAGPADLAGWLAPLLAQAAA